MVLALAFACACAQSRMRHISSTCCSIAIARPEGCRASEGFHLYACQMPCRPDALCCNEERRAPIFRGFVLVSYRFQRLICRLTIQLNGEHFQMLSCSCALSVHGKHLKLDQSSTLGSEPHGWGLRVYQV